MERPIRFAIFCFFVIALAVGLALQSAGIALTRKAPQTAVALFPLNGLAEEYLASTVFTSSLSDSGEPRAAARSAEGWALSSYRHEPLTPKSHAFLALAQEENDAWRKIVGISSKLDRREPLLQALVLQEHVETENYGGVVESLDGILRVKPSRAAELFPVLLNVFLQDEAVEELAKILDGSSPWHQQFVRFAARQPSALPNLIKLRRRVSFDDEKLDQALIRGLAKEGDLRSAYDLYAWLSNSRARKKAKDTLNWVTAFPPFDWSFTDTGEFRAQPSLDSDGLEFYVRSGNGGIFARRIIETPSAPFSIAVKNEITPANLAKDVKLTLTCAKQKETFSETVFRKGELYHLVNAVPRDCPFIEIALTARAWSGQSALRGTISPLIIKQQ